MTKEAVLTKSANNKDLLKLWKSRKKQPADIYKVSKDEVRVKTIFVFPCVIVAVAITKELLAHLDNRPSPYS